jgi:protoheme IX farnesyltransferase
MPPLLGWVAVTGHIAPEALLLVFIIFLWTPPHFWALAIHRFEDYKRAEIPMLPNTHGIPYTKIQIVLYTILMCIASVLPYFLHMSGWIYLVTIILLDARFLYLALHLYYDKESKLAFPTFRYSILYLMGLFTVLLIDHWSVVL